MINTSSNLDEFNKLMNSLNKKEDTSNGVVPKGKGTTVKAKGLEDINSKEVKQ